jgi:hypothetical protein
MSIQLEQVYGLFALAHNHEEGALKLREEKNKRHSGLVRHIIEHLKMHSTRRARYCMEHLKRRTHEGHRKYVSKCSPSTGRRKDGVGAEEEGHSR